jgi:hypothetical protein
MQEDYAHNLNMHLCPAGVCWNTWNKFMNLEKRSALKGDKFEERKKNQISNSSSSSNNNNSNNNNKNNISSFF